MPGYEVAGTVSASGAEVRHLHVGDRVVALTKFGGYASSAVLPTAYVFKLSGSMSDVEAAALPVNYLTATKAHYKLANVAAGRRSSSTAPAAASALPPFSWPNSVAQS